MIRVLKSSLVFLILVSAIVSALNFLVPYYWGSESTVSRFQINEAEIADSNVLFFGSSRTLYHIHGRIFSKKTKTKAYNLGIQQGRILELNKQIKSFVDRHPVTGKNKQIIYELCALERLQPKVMHTNRIRHFWDFGVMAKAIKYNFITKDFSEIKRCIQTYLEFLFKVDFIKEYFLAEEHIKKIKSDEFYGATTMNNCYGCVMNGNNSLAENKKSSENVKKKLRRVIGYYNPDKKLTNDELKQKQFLLEEIESLISYVNEKGYEVIILNQTGPLLLQVKLYEELKSKGYKAIDMGNPHRNPEFYKPENLFDISHLTRKGAMAFTEKLITKYNELPI